MGEPKFFQIAEDLEIAGLIWHPEIGDEVLAKKAGSVSVLVDPQGMSLNELRDVFLWLPTVEQMILQFEARQAILLHAGLELTSAHMCYKTVLQTPHGAIESRAISLRNSVGIALRNLLLSGHEEIIN